MNIQILFNLRGVQNSFPPHPVKEIEIKGPKRMGKGMERKKGKEKGGKKKGKGEEKGKDNSGKREG